MDANSFSERVRRTRMAAGFQGKTLAMQLGISRPYLTQIEKGLRQPSKDLLTRLACELQVTPYWLLHGAHPTANQCPEISNDETRIAELEHQLAVAHDTINNLSKALAQGRALAAPASGAHGGGAHAAPPEHPNNRRNAS